MHTHKTNEKLVKEKPSEKQKARVEPNSRNTRDLNGLSSNAML